MAMTMTQKILAAHAGLEQVHAGQLIEAELDLMLGNDVTTPAAINVLEQTGVHTLVAPEKAVFVLDRSEERRVGKECRSRWSPYH